MAQVIQFSHPAFHHNTPRAPASDTPQSVNKSTPSVYLVDVDNGFFAPEGDWLRLTHQLGGHPFFLSPDWLGTWWKTYGQGRQPLVFRADEATHPVAAVPLCMSSARINQLKVREIGWIGSGARVCPEHIDALGNPHGSAAEMIARWLQQHRDAWDIVRLLDSRPGGFAATLAQHMETAGFVTQITPCSCCPRIVLPTTYQALVAGYSYNMRRTIKRIDKRLKLAGGYRVEWFDIVSDRSDQSIHQAINEMTRLHTIARAAHNQPGNFSDAVYRAFHRELIARTLDSDQLRLAFLYHNGKQGPVAFRYGFLHNDTWLDYQTGFDTAYQKQRVGWYLLGECLQRAIVDGANVFDMLRGNHEYKRHWATAYQDTETAWIFNNNLRGRLTQLALFGKHIIKSMQRGMQHSQQMEVEKSSE